MSRNSKLAPSTLFEFFSENFDEQLKRKCKHCGRGFGEGMTENDYIFYEKHCLKNKEKI